jgi:hypothetical protein
VIPPVAGGPVGQRPSKGGACVRPGQTSVAASMRMEMGFVGMR